jgi:hypothetical protein
MPPCEEHSGLIALTAKIEQGLSDFKKSFDEVKQRFIDHIIEGEKPGGIRDRLKDVEAKGKELKELIDREVSAIKKAMWFRAVVSGIIGGFIVKCTPDMMGAIFKFFLNHVFAGQ